MKSSHTLLLFAIAIVFSCSKEEQIIDDGGIEVSTQAFSFIDDFETTSNDLNELFPLDESRWTNIQQVDTETGPNQIELSSEHINLGEQSLYIFSRSTDETLSKIDIEKFGFQAFEDAEIHFEADFYIATEGNIENLFLFDLETCSCWDPEVPNNQCPGIRLKMGGPDDYLSLERGKIALTTIAQGDIQFPRNEWVNVALDLKLSPTDGEAENSVFINGQEIISSTLSNMPSQAVFGPLFEAEGIDFQMQEPVFYERFQLGATANNSISDIELYIDDVKFIVE